MDISTTIDLISLVLFAVGLGITIGKIKKITAPLFFPQGRLFNQNCGANRLLTAPHFF